MTTHVLKCWPVYFARLVDGTKTFEVRRDDRGYQAGDILELREWEPDRCQAAHDDDDEVCPAWTGRSRRYRVGWIFRQGVGVDLGEYVILSLLPEFARGGVIAPP